MSITARTWNVFHGRTVPERRGDELERMVRLVAAGAPDVLCLQEVPVWALPRIGAWAGMAVVTTVTRRAPPVPARRWLTGLWPAGLRSGLTGQANVTLVARSHRLGAVSRLRLDRRRGPFAERRYAQAIEIAVGTRELLVANAHLTNDPRVAERELGELAAWLVACAGERPVVLAGDLNVSPLDTRLFVTLAGAGWSAPGPGIDHVLARGLLVARGPYSWPEEGRRHGGALLSDHAPVEAEMMWP